MLRLDDLFADRPPTLFKIGVEGFGQEVLAGATGLLMDRRAKAFIVEIVGKPEPDDEGSAFLRLNAAGFRAFTYAPFERRLDAIDAAKPSGDTIFISDVDWARRRLAEARKINEKGSEL